MADELLTGLQASAAWADEQRAAAAAAKTAVAAPEQMRGEVKGPMPAEGAWRQVTDSTQWRNGIPGGGGKLADPDATPGHLIIVTGDWLSNDPYFKIMGKLPELVQDGLGASLDSLCGRCVVVCTGGHGLSHTMVSQLVARIGLDECGPGRKVEAVLKERSAEFGNIFESALLCKALAKRQCSGIHFEQVTVITAEAVADATRRVYEVAFSDWKPKLKLNTRGVPTSDEEITTRAAAIGDEAWFERNASTYETHPSMPRTLASPLRRLLKREREGEEAEDESPAPHAPARREPRVE